MLICFYTDYFETCKQFLVLYSHDVVCIYNTFAQTSIRLMFLVVVSLAQLCVEIFNLSPSGCGGTRGARRFDKMYV